MDIPILMRPCAVVPSLLAANFARLGEDVLAMEACGVDALHVDVMDYHFVPNLTVGPMVCEALRQYGVRLPLDVHLMTQPVEPLLEPFAQAGADGITFHPEATPHVHRALARIRQLGCHPGVALNPATPLSVLDHIWDLVDQVLVMGVDPGFGGQPMWPGTVDKVHRVAELARRCAPHPVRIGVDGGVRVEVLPALKAAGANWFVAGTALWDRPQASVERFRAALEGQQVDP